MINRTPNRDIALASGSDVGEDKDWMPIGMFQLDIETGALLQKTASGLAYRYISETVELGGDFDAVESVKCVRVGDSVTITSIGSLGHSNSSFPQSSTGAIPEIYRPSSATSVVYSFASGDVSLVGVFGSGTFFTQYRDWSGTSASKTSAGVTTLTYNV